MPHFGQMPGFGQRLGVESDWGLFFRSSVVPTFHARVSADTTVRAGQSSIDEKQVRALAAQQSAVLEQLVAANAREDAKLYRVLSSDQQARVDRLEQKSLSSAK